MVGTRRALLDLLKLEGPRDSGALARRLGVSAMAVRQHLYELQERLLVTFEAEPRPMGRPAKLWRLTPEADRFFPNGHADLTRGLLAAAGRAFGPGGLERIVDARVREQISEYRRHVDPRAPLRGRLAALARLRTAEGYLAQVLPQRDGSFLLVENHCPISAAAAQCRQLCSGELQVFEAVLGRRVSVERTEHILGGARRCAYRVRPVSKRRR
jgi:predicted ArsR family transcriptional regulator